jgi:hypothetical protein
MTLVIPCQPVPLNLMMERRRILAWPRTQDQEEALHAAGFKPWHDVHHTWGLGPRPADETRVILCGLAHAPAIFVCNSSDAPQLRAMGVPHINGYQHEIDTQNEKNESMRRQLAGLIDWIGETAFPREEPET